MSFILKTLLLLGALFFYQMGVWNIEEVGEDTGFFSVAYPMFGIWAAWVVLSFFLRRSANKALEEKEKDTVDAYANAEQEIEANNKDEGIWKKAFVDADGDESKQKALYMKYRAEEINS